MISMPVWGGDNLLFCFSGYDGGSQLLKLTRNGNKTVVEQVWASRLMRVHLGNAIGKKPEAASHSWNRAGHVPTAS